MIIIKLNMLIRKVYCILCVCVPFFVLHPHSLFFEPLTKFETQFDLAQEYVSSILVNMSFDARLEERNSNTKTIEMT